MGFSLRHDLRLEAAVAILTHFNLDAPSSISTSGAVRFHTAKTDSLRRRFTADR
jgi:hypothetical protein